SRRLTGCPPAEDLTLPCRGLHCASHQFLTADEGMSALPPESRHRWDVRFVPKADICSAARVALFDHLVGADEQCRRRGDPERFSRLEIDNCIKFGRPLDRKFARLRTLQNLVNERGCPIVHISKVDAQGNKASCPCKFRK